MSGKAIEAVREQGLRRWVLKDYVRFPYTEHYAMRERLEGHLRALFGLAHNFSAHHYVKAYNASWKDDEGVFDATQEEADAVDSKRVHPSQYQQGNRRLTCTAEQAKAMADFLDTLQECITQAYLSGKKEGVSLLRSLASGEMTMRELEKETIKK